MAKTFSAENLIKLSFILLALTPFAVIHGTFFPFMFGKAVFVRLMIGIAGVLFAVGVLNKKNPIRPKLGRLFNPLMTAYVAFTALALLSTFLSVNPYRSFWGNVERSEGFLILIYMLIFFIGTLLFFDRKDWLNFFKVNLLVGGVIAIDVLIEWFGGATPRADGSFLDNSAVTATYSIFVIFFALIVGALDKNKVWRYLGGGIGITSVVAVLATGTRAVFVGLAVGAFVVLLRLALIRKPHVKLGLFKKSIDVRKLSAALLLLIIVFSVVFVFTRSSPVWRGVPGLDRLAQISSTDPATQARLINIGVSFDAVNPVNVGITRTLFGWGPENYVSAHNQFYDPSIQKFEVNWFDRAHNKVLDVLVMNGLLGLTAYLFLWGLLIWKAFTTKPQEGDNRSFGEEFWVALAIGGIATAYFVQNLFFFDTIAIYIPLFTLFSFSAYTYYVRAGETREENAGTSRPSMPVKLGSVVLGVLLVTSFIWTAVVPIYQMRTLTGGLRQGDLGADDISRITTPDNFIQSEVRSIALFSALDILPKDNVALILPQMLELGEEALTRTDNRARREHEMGIIYNDAFKVYGEEEYLARGEGHLRKALNLVPGRQRVAFVLVENLTLQGRFGELEEIMNDARVAEPEGINIDLFYLSYLAPSDIDGSRGTIEGLKQIYMRADRIEENVIVTDSDLIYVRESYSNHIHYAHRVGDEELLRSILVRTIEIEKALREIVDFQAENGLIPKSVDTREEIFRQALATLDEHGIEAIRLR